jgi:hypothetical protein
MMPIKIQCGCGQKYAFEAEPINGQMANAVTCPVCGVDGTGVANQIIADAMAAQAPPPAPSARLRAATPAPAASAEAVARPAVPVASRVPLKKEKEFSMGLGILGALIGAAVGAAAMFGFSLATGFRFPLLGVGIGALTGYGAKLLGRGTESGLGAIAGGIALVSVVGTLFLIYGAFPILSIISVLVSVSVAYRIASG